MISDLVEFSGAFYLTDRAEAAAQFAQWRIREAQVVVLGKSL
jgi:hypothetical protein